jgi:hypothetical protein
LVPVRSVDEDRGGINDGENVGVVGKGFATNDLVDVLWKEALEDGCDGTEAGCDHTCDGAFLEIQRMRDGSGREPGGEVEHEEEEARQGRVPESPPPASLGHCFGDEGVELLELPPCKGECISDMACPALGHELLDRELVLVFLVSRFFFFVRSFFSPMDFLMVIVFSFASRFDESIEAHQCVAHVTGRP